MIEIYGRGTCGWTQNATLLCELEGISYTLHDLNELENKPKLDELRDSGINLPAIYSKTRLIGGYQALQQWIIMKQENDIKWQQL